MNFVVVGAGYGDEGKGQTVSNLISKYKDIHGVIRFNGGQQAGHTVVHNGVRHIFSNFGAGTLQGVPTYWSKYCTINPSTIRREYKVLKSLGVTPRLYIDPMCPVTTPFDIFANRYDENNLENGTVGEGFGKTIQRQEDHFKLHAIDLKHSPVYIEKTQSTHTHYYSYLSYKKYPDLLNLMNSFYDDIHWLVNNKDIYIGEPYIPTWDNVIFEGAQGILLDQDFGFFPHVTRSKTTPYNAVQLAKYYGIEIDEICYVSRYYHTRHGNGSFKNAPIKLKDNIIETNVNNIYQGTFKIGALDLDLLKYALEVSRKENPDIHDKVVLTCKDHLIDDEVKVHHKGLICTYSTKELEEIVRYL